MYYYFFGRFGFIVITICHGQGLWMGIICGLSVQVVALVTVNACTNWDQEVSFSLFNWYFFFLSFFVEVVSCVSSLGFFSLRTG